MTFKQWFKEFTCVLFKHKWETIEWVSKKDVNTRKDKCKRCKRELTVKDERAALVKEFKKLVWEQRRQVIVEKHKNPKEYVVRASHKEVYVDIHKEIMLLDENVESVRTNIRNLCTDNGVEATFLQLVCVDEPEVPEEFIQ